MHARAAESAAPFCRVKSPDTPPVGVEHAVKSLDDRDRRLDLPRIEAMVDSANELEFTRIGDSQQRFPLLSQKDESCPLMPRIVNQPDNSSFRPVHHRLGHGLASHVTDPGQVGDGPASFFQKPAFYALLALGLLSAAGAVLLIGHRRKRKRRRDKYKTIPIDPERIADVTAGLLRLMDEERLFLDPDLTLKKLSLRLRIHYNHLSRIVNERFGMSYNDFLNQYRIEEAKKKLAAREEKDSTILDIAYGTGFYSKSVFNAAFKKFTGMTPTEYRKKLRQKNAI